MTDTFLTAPEKVEVEREPIVELPAGVDAVDLTEEPPAEPRRRGRPRGSRTRAASPTAAIDRLLAEVVAAAEQLKAAARAQERERAELQRRLDGLQELLR
jgi:hypothetical protein